MCEIWVLIVMSGRVGELADRKGLNGTLFRLLFVLGWIFGQVFGFIVGFALLAARGGDGTNLFIVYPISFICAMLGAGSSYLLMAVIPEAKKSGRGSYMDDYYEYQRTGKINTKKRYDDQDEDEDRPKRRRRRDDDDDDRPRRRRDDDRARRRDDDDDDRPRRRRDEDDDDRPRRRRRDED